MTAHPVRIQLHRTKGFDLQKASRAVNGLPAKSVCRPGPSGNPFKIGGKTGLPRAQYISRFKDWLTETPEGRALAERGKRELKGFNLACYCKPGQPCHADIWLKTVN